MKFRLEIRDRNFVTKDILEDEALDLNWAYSRIGGCGEFSFRLPRKRFGERAITGEYNVRIYNRSSTGYNLWYQGLVENKIPNVRGNTEDIEISGHGYVAQLSRIYINNVTYTSTEVSVIVKSILDNYVTPYTNISYSVSDLVATSFTIDSIQFNDTVLDAIQKLADIVGTREWGVDANRNFFFKARSSTILRFLSGINITNFQDNQDFTQIVNQIYIQGAQAGGTYYTAGPYNDLSSQSKYNLRTEIIQNSSVSTSSVALQLATAELADKSEVSKRASCDLINFNAQLESTIPVPLFTEVSRNILYGQKKYGTFLYSGLVTRVVNRINYSLTNNNSLNISLDLGQLRPSLAEDIKQLEYQLSQATSAAL